MSIDRDGAGRLEGRVLGIRRGYVIETVAGEYVVIRKNSQTYQPESEPDFYFDGGGFTKTRAMNNAPY
jgi:hypothetical protein